MSVREARLAEDLRNMEELRRQSTLIDFVARGTPPDEYLVTYRCRGLIDPARQSNEHVAEIYLHAEYPRLPPKVSFLTQIFHPNIVAAIQVAPVQERLERVLAAASSDEERQRMMQEISNNKELFKAHVCLDALDYNWTPSLTLEQICIELGEMIQYKRFNAGDPLNPEAAWWAESHRNLLPIDRRSLLDLRGLPEVLILGDDLETAAVPPRSRQREAAPEPPAIRILEPGGSDV